jgi:hypothetical protein
MLRLFGEARIACLLASHSRIVTRKAIRSRHGGVTRVITSHNESSNKVTAPEALPGATYARTLPGFVASTTGSVLAAILSRGHLLFFRRCRRMWPARRSR